MAIAIAEVVVIAFVIGTVLNNTSYITIPAYQGHNSFCLFGWLK